MASPSLKPKWLIALSVFMIVFGVLTILSGGRVLFTEAGHNEAGHIVPLVLWFNFLSGFLYILGGVSLFRLKSYAKKIALALALLCGAVLVYLIWYIYKGNPFEMRTVFAMIFRSVFLSGAAWILRKRKSSAASP